MYNRSSGNKANESANDNPILKEVETAGGNSVKPIQEKETGTAVDFDLALDYEEMDAPHSDNEVEAKEDTTTKSIQNSQNKTKDEENGESSDDSSGRGITRSQSFISFVHSFT